MFVHEALRLRLIADTDVAAISTRFYPGFLTQDVTYPAVAYRLVSKDTPTRLDTRGHCGLAQFRLRFYSTTDKAHGGYDSAKNLDDAIRLCLQGFAGTITDATVSPVETLDIEGIFHDNTVDGYEDQTQTYQVISDYLVWAEETSPS